MIGLANQKPASVRQDYNINTFPLIRLQLRRIANQRILDNGGKSTLIWILRFSIYLYAL